MEPSRACPDPELDAYFQASDDDHARRVLDGVVRQHVDPTIRSTVGARLCARGGAGVDAQNADEVCAEARSSVIAHLDRARRDGAAVVVDLRAHVTVTARNACDDYLRGKHPERERLRKQVRYLLTHHPAFACWEMPGAGWYGGFAEWRGRRPGLLSRRRVARLAQDPALCVPPSPTTSPAIEHLACGVFRYTGCPLPLDTLVTTLAALQGAVEHETDLSAADSAPSRDPETDPERVLAARAELAGLWDEILCLPDRQRAAILLHLDEIALFPLLGVADIPSLATTLGMTPESLADLWPRLPLEDSEVASILSVTRQQVINLRKSARARLARRMAAGHSAKPGNTGHESPSQHTE